MIETDLQFWLLASLAAVFVGLSKGGVPVIALLSVPVLSLVVNPLTAVGLMLPVYIVSDVFALLAYRRDYHPAVLKIGIVGMTIGIGIGWATAHVLIEWVITFLMGVIGGSFAVRLMAQNAKAPAKAKPVEVPKGLFWSTIAGFTSFISHNGGPPWQIFTLPLKMPKVQFIGTSVIAFSYCNAAKLVPYVALGTLNVHSFKTSLFLMIPASLAVFIGVRIIKIIPEELFSKILTWALLLISLRLIWDGIAAALS